MAKSIVVIGATGHFGGRICRRLVDQPDIDLTVTSRSAAKANALKGKLETSGTGAGISSAALDQSAPTFSADLAALRPHIVIHTAGPYQDQDYTVAEACISCRSHYIDLADGRDFVAGFDKLNEQAIAHGLLLVTGASTLPGLSTAVIDHLRDQFSALQCIRITIAPAHRTPRGTGTIAAVLSYCGSPFLSLENGNWQTVYGWQDLKVQRYPNLGLRLSGACDVPDLELLPRYAAGATTVSFHAALEAKWEQLALWCMAGLTRLNLVRDWGRFVPAFHKISERLIGLGSDRGGMQVILSGAGLDGRSTTLTWNLTALQNHGPEVPCSPALVLARRLIANDLELRGARPCLGLISLAEFAAEVAQFDIDWYVTKA